MSNRFRPDQPDYITQLNLMDDQLNAAGSPTNPVFQSLTVNGLLTAGNGTFKDVLKITSGAGIQRLLMGNQDASGANNPSVIQAASGVLMFGNGDSWAGAGGVISTFASFAKTGINFVPDLTVNGSVRASNFQPTVQPFNFDSTYPPGMYQCDGGLISGTKPPDLSDNYRVLVLGSASRYTQLAFPWAGNYAWLYRRQDTQGVWQRILTSGTNLDTSVAGAQQVTAYLTTGAGDPNFRLAIRNGSNTSGSSGEEARIGLERAGLMNSGISLYRGTSGTDGSLVLWAGGGTRWQLIDNGDFRPTVDNAYSLGWPNYRSSVIYAGTGTINTSDAREKTAIDPLSVSEIAAAKELAKEVGTYQWLDCFTGCSISTGVPSG